MSPLLADRWIEIHSGPFEVVTDAGAREGRETLNELEQFRHALGSVLGVGELRSVWPMRVVLFESQRDLATYGPAPAGFALRSDAHMGAAYARSPLPRPLLRECARILIASSMNRLPENIEAGVATLFSTLDVSAVRISLGQPPPEAERTLAWATLHMLTVTPGYYGKLRVLVRNLAQGSEVEPAYRNAFGKPPSAVESEAAAYLKAGSFSTVPVSGRVIRQEREFVESPLAEARARDLLSELRGGASSETSGSAAPPADGAGARVYVEYARREPDAAKALLVLIKAAEKNPRWAAPHLEMARRETDPKKKIELLKKATELDPRGVDCWRTLAETYTAQQQFPEAARAWAAAEQAAPNDAERERLRAIRSETAAKRLEFDEAERQRLAAEERRKIEDLKRQAADSIQAALAAANKDGTPAKPGEKVVEWWDEQKGSAKVEGILSRVDCLGSRLRLVIEVQKGKATSFLVSDPKRLVVRGGGEVTFGCGVQRPPRRLIAEYTPRPDARAGTAGDVVAIEFRK